MGFDVLNGNEQSENGFLKAFMNILNSQKDKQNINFPLQKVHVLKPFMAEVDLGIAEFIKKVMRT